MTSGAAASAEPELSASFDDVSQRLERLVRLVYVGSRPAATEVDAVLRDAARLSRGDLGVPSWRIAEFDDDLRAVARYRTQQAASTPSSGMELPTQRRTTKRRRGPAPDSQPVVEPAPPVKLIQRAGAVLDAVDAGETITTERIRALQEELRVAINVASSRRDPVAATLKSLHGRLARSRGRMEARHARAAATPVSAPARRPVTDAKKGRTLRSLIPSLRRGDKVQRVVRAAAPNALEPREQAHRLARALELGQNVTQAQITDVLYRLAAPRNERSSSTDLAADRKALQRLEAADRKARQRARPR